LVNSIELKVVQLRFKWAKGSYGRYPIRITTLDVEKIKQDAVHVADFNQKVARIGDYGDMFTENFCHDYGHSDECIVHQDVYGISCALDDYKRAKEHLERLERLDDLLSCISKPFEANSLNVLQGLAQESPVHTIQ